MSYEPDVVAAYQQRTDRRMIRSGEIELSEADLDFVKEAGVTNPNEDVWGTSPSGTFEFREGKVYLNGKYEG